MRSPPDAPFAMLQTRRGSCSVKCSWLSLLVREVIVDMRPLIIFFLVSVRDSKDDFLIEMRSNGVFSGVVIHDSHQQRSANNLKCWSLVSCSMPYLVFLLERGWQCLAGIRVKDIQKSQLGKPLASGTRAEMLQWMEKQHRYCRVFEKSVEIGKVIMKEFSRDLPESDSNAAHIPLHIQRVVNGIGNDAFLPLFLAAGYLRLEVHEEYLTPSPGQPLNSCWSDVGCNQFESSRWRVMKIALVLLAVLVIFVHIEVRHVIFLIC